MSRWRISRDGPLMMGRAATGAAALVLLVSACGSDPGENANAGPVERIEGSSAEEDGGSPEMILIHDEGVGEVVLLGATIKQLTKRRDRRLGPDIDVYEEEQSGYAEINLGSGVHGLGDPLYYLGLSAGATTDGVPIQTEGGVGVGSDVDEVLTAHPDATQPCLPDQMVTWGQVDFYIDDSNDEVRQVGISLPGGSGTCYDDEHGYDDF